MTEPLLPHTPPGTPPTAGPWPPGWVPWTPRPPAQVNWLTLLGGVLVFIGWILFAVADLAFATLPVNASYGQVLGTYLVYVVGDVVIAIGFLLAFYSLALRRT